MEDLKNKMEDFKNFHPAHGLLFGIGAGFIGKNYGYDFMKTTAIVGVGSYLYMNKYGHSLPGNINKAGESSGINGIIPHVDPDNTQQLPEETTVIKPYGNDYYDGFDERLADALQKGISSLNDWIAEPKHKDLHGAELADAIYYDLNLVI